MVMKTTAIIFFSMLPFLVTGQQLGFYSLKKLPPAVNSEGEEGLPLLSPDGHQLFFTRALYAGNAGGKFSGLDVWYSEFNVNSWKPSTNMLAGGINNQGHNALIGISRDGNTRYFMSVSPNEKMNGIYFTSRINSYWTRPEFVPVPGIENENFLGVFISPDSDVMFFSMKGPDSRGEEDLYFSVKNSSGQWSAPRNMGPTINTAGFEISPFFSVDKKRLYFASNGHGGEGDADIFYSERLYNSWETWSVPTNLGKLVNSKKFDAYFSIYGDSIAYFASNRDGRLSDIYSVKFTAERTVLAPGQRYLPETEWNRLLGGPVSNEIVFPSRSANLSASQKELLFYIANKLQLESDIRLHLVVEEEENPALTTQQLSVISQELVLSGIDAERVLFQQLETVSKSSRGKIVLRLIE